MRVTNYVVTARMGQNGRFSTMSPFMIIEKLKMVLSFHIGVSHSKLSNVVQLLGKHTLRRLYECLVESMAAILQRSVHARTDTHTHARHICS